ncbi:heterodimeric methylmalonyl-CoA mutase small subunit [Aquimarina amphilecti]|uniref:Heterodimeric methylmalonyl-CoA mutase small subunit n=1 Tax=Aquimarina amphilecti TaxID=1038014 RepID=A0A1H7TP47_AQUAM|nr:methylmalonyl-CoA mutase subunit beta [Aquimarina amphilecti]SEL86531.1 heterodimeric methylmalonyl-CoA mutase small subunit [Aquimarina amphilecti]
MTKTLFNDFDKVSAKEWKQKIQFDLKGADYNEALIYKSYEGIDVKPFYNEEDITTDHRNVNHPSSWKNSQQINVEDAVSGNNAALTAIKKGAETIYFTITTDKIDPAILLSGISPDIIVFIETLFLSKDYIGNLNSCALKLDFSIHLLIDIIGNLATTGNWHKSLKDDHTKLENIISENSNLKISITADLSILQNSGATMVQQLAYGLAHINEYLNYFENRKDTSFTKTPVIFKVAVGGNYFFEIAKLRALRILWNSLSEEYNMLKKCYIFAHPSHRNKTILDYNVNMLRTTTECMSAILGGANIIHNLRYDDIYNLENDFGTRIAINQLLILKNESYFDIVNNPSSGSYYIESLTNQLADKSLSLFKNIEESGGYLQQLKAGTIQKKIKESADKEQELFDKEEIILTGANTYKNPEEVIPPLQKALFKEKNVRKTLINPIISRRLCEKIEKNII